MRTILIIALAANIMFSFGAGYLQSAIAGQSAAGAVHQIGAMASAASPSSGYSKF